MIASIRHENILLYLSLDIIVPQSSQFSSSFTLSELLASQNRSADKYPCIFSVRIEAIVYITIYNKMNRIYIFVTSILKLLVIYIFVTSILKSLLIYAI